MARLEEQTSPLACTPSVPPTLAVGVHPGVPAGGQPLLIRLSRAGAASSSGSRSILAELLREPEPSPEPKHGGALAPSPALGAPPSLPSLRQGGSRSNSAPKAARGGWSRGRLAPHSPNPDRAVWAPGHPGASPDPPLLPLLLPCSHRGNVGDTPRGTEQSPHPPHTHIPVALPFGVAAAGEFQLFQHLYLFWLTFLFRPRYKLKAALLLTSSKLHLLTSLPRLLAGRGLLLAGADALALEVCRKASEPDFSPLAWLGTGCQQRLLAKGACHR